MITIEVRNDHISVSGHAGYADHGHDIVCAAVSALWQNLTASIEALTEDKIKYRTTPDGAIMEYANPSKETSLFVDSFFIGVAAVANAYPDHVKLI